MKSPKQTIPSLKSVSLQLDDPGEGSIASSVMLAHLQLRVIAW